MKKYLIILSLIFASCLNDVKKPDKFFQSYDIGTFGNYTVTVIAIKNNDTLYLYDNGAVRTGSYDRFYSTENLTKFNSK